MKVLFVCTGNINRSAAAEFMLRAVHPDWQILGAATNLKSNKPMAKKIRERLASLGYVGMEQHRSQALTKDLINWADVVIGFQDSHLIAVATLGGVAKSLVDYLPEESKRFTKVPDPAFDSSGLTHILVTELIQLAIPNIKE